MDIFNRLVEDLLEKNILSPGESIVLGVSGGPDSMFLLELFLRLPKGIVGGIKVAHVNHGIRGAAADADEEFVKTYCENRGIPCFTRRGNMNDLARKWKMSPEEAGRKLRYDFFYSLLDRGGKVALAHTLDDQAETVLMRLIRGTGPEGLGGMEELSGSLFRPLLGVRRREIIEALEDYKIPYCTDATNLETEYTRNYIRRKILPLMKELNPRIKESLGNLATFSREDRHYFDEVVDEYLRGLTREDGDVLFGPEILKVPLALQKRYLKGIFMEAAGTAKDLSSAQLQVMVDSLGDSSGKQRHLSHGIVLTREFDHWRMGPEKKGIFGEFPLELGENETPWGIFTVTEERRGDFTDPNVLFLNDIDDLILREKRRGDRMVPWGRASEKKVKDLFQSEGVPVSHRDRIPLLVQGEKVLWIVGVRKGNFPFVEGKKVYRIKRGK